MHSNVNEMLMMIITGWHTVGYKFTRYLFLRCQIATHYLPFITLSHHILLHFNLKYISASQNVQNLMIIGVYISIYIRVGISRGYIKMTFYSITVVTFQYEIY